jgi:aminoglycoside phosphotransferase
MAFLNPCHPLFHYLTAIVYPQLSARLEKPRFRIAPLPGSHGVYLFSEEMSQRKVIVKYCFLPESVNHRTLALREREFDQLLLLRDLGFNGSPCRVARPLGNRNNLLLGLVLEWEEGRNLDFFLQQAINQNAGAPLFVRLEQLAFFLAGLHQKTQNGRPVDWSSVETYFQKVLGHLSREGLVVRAEENIFFGLIDRWLSQLAGIETLQVLVHGDATPTNFIFTSEGELVAIDLERVRASDRSWDLGMVCGEIKHAFLWRRRDRWGSEPFIRHFLKTYASFFPDPGKMFHRICRFNPLIMAVTELRIARNSYLDLPYRRILIGEARDCLRGGLQLP